MDVKHVSNVTFYHLSNRCLPNVMKINVKINTMQNTKMLFVRSLSLTNWKNAQLRYGLISDRSLLTLQWGKILLLRYVPHSINGNDVIMRTGDASTVGARRHNENDFIMGMGAASAAS